MSVKIESGRWTYVWHPKVASTAFAGNEFVTMNSGFVGPSVAGDTTLLGVNQDNVIAASDATTREIPILVPRSVAQVRATVTGTLANTDEGETFDLSDSETVDKTATATNVVRCTKFISATEGIFTIALPQFV